MSKPSCPRITNSTAVYEREYDREELRDEADKFAREVLKVSDYDVALELLREGELAGTVAESAMRRFEFLLNAE